MPEPVLHKGPDPGSDQTPDPVPADPSSGHRGPGRDVVTFRMFAAARSAAGTHEVQVEPGPTPAVMASLTAHLPPRFAEVLAASSLVADGFRLDPSSSAPIIGGTTVDVLPPFAGG